MKEVVRLLALQISIKCDCQEEDACVMQCLHTLQGHIYFVSAFLHMEATMMFQGFRTTNQNKCYDRIFCQY